jgi:hypothetical protein
MGGTKIGFPLSKELVERELIIAQGTITGAKNHSIHIFNIAGLIMLTQLMVKPLFTVTKPLQLSFF